MVHRRDLPTEPVNYRELKGHPFEERFPDNMEIHIQQHRQQFKSWESVSSANAKGHQVGKVLKLNRALYGLRRSPLLWQQKLADEMKKLGF